MQAGILAVLFGSNLRFGIVMFLCSRAERIPPRDVTYFLLYEWSFQTNSFKII